MKTTILLFVFLALNLSAADGTDDRAKTDERTVSASSEGGAETLITGDGTNLVVKSSIKTLPKLAEGEALMFVVFLTRTNGPALDKHIVEPDGVRVRRSERVRGLLLADGFPVGSYLEIVLAGAEGFERAGYELDGMQKDVDGGATWEIPVGLYMARVNEAAKSLGQFSQQLDFDWFAGHATVSAALYVFKAGAEKKTEFVRFVSPVTSKRVEFKH